MEGVCLRFLVLGLRSWAGFSLGVDFEFRGNFEALSVGVWEGDRDVRFGHLTWNCVGLAVIWSCWIPRGVRWVIG